MLRGSKYISLGLINVVFELPGFAIGVGHANHDGSGLHQGEKPAKWNKKSQTFPAIRQDIFYKSKGGGAASCKEHRLKAVF